MTTTTDPQDELFDVLDAEGNLTGISKPRGEVHRDGDWHRGLHIWVYGFDPDGTPFMLFQRRSKTKDTWPGKLDVAVGGHYRAGESLAETLRETEEEIGLTTSVVTPSSGWRRMTSLLGLGAPSAWSKIEWGIERNWMTISDTLSPSRLPVRK